MPMDDKRAGVCEGGGGGLGAGSDDGAPGDPLRNKHKLKVFRLSGAPNENIV